MTEPAGPQVVQVDAFQFVSDLMASFGLEVRLAVVLVCLTLGLLAGRALFGGSGGL